MPEMHTDEEIQAMSQDRPDVAGWMAWGRRFGWRCVGTALGTATFDLPSGERQIISGEARDTISAALPEPMTDDDLKAIRERVGALTPVTWVTKVCHTDEGGRHVCIYGAWTHDDPFARLNEPDAAFIAAAKSDVPRLLDEVERLRKRVAELEDDLSNAI